MSFAPLLAAATPIPAHAMAALFALVLGVSQMLAHKGTKLHKVMGRLWVVAMAFVAASSFFIYELRMLGPVSPIHILSVIALYYLFVGVRAARKGNIRLHRAVMKNLFWLGLVVTGWFTLLPGRVMYEVLFGG